jgi:hypothetical protein
MFTAIGNVGNFIVVPNLVPDETDPSGGRRDDRLQVTLELASNEKTVTIEFRLGEGSEAPAEQQLMKWLEDGELVQAFCTGCTAKPFIHNPEKTYRNAGKEVEVADGVKAEIDAFVVFAGVSMAPLAGGPALEEVVKKVRAAHKRSQRDFRLRRNAERLRELEEQLPARLKAMQERKAAQAAAAAEKAQADAGATAGPNGRKR